MSTASAAALVRRLSFALLIFLPLATAVQAAPVERKLCIWDPVGNSGPVENLFKGAQIKALEWGVKLDLAVYTDESVAANDLKGGVCDGAVLTDDTVRRFDSFTGTLGAIGAINSQKEMDLLVQTLASPKAAPLMRDGRYEVAGILPIGSVFIFVRDRSVNTIERMQGKRMAVLNADPVALNMVHRVGGSAVNASLSTFAGLFNNGSVDIIFAPAVAFESMELYKGLGKNGGIIRYPLLYTSLQALIRWKRFPPGFGQHMRAYLASQAGAMGKTVTEAENKIPKHYWVSIPRADRQKYDAFMRNSRIDLMHKGLYNAKALHLMKEVRCHFHPDAGECADNKE